MTADVLQSGNRKQEHERSADQIPDLDTGDQNQTVPDRNPCSCLDDAEGGRLKDSKRDQRKHDKNAEICSAKNAKETIKGR
jgi:hypothetical protein